MKSNIKETVKRRFSKPAFLIAKIIAWINVSI